MKTALWLNRTLIELVFERRNHAYGAYDLRLRYEQNMARAIFLSTAIFITAWVSLLLWQNREKATAIIEKFVVTPVELSDKVPIKKPVVSPPAAPLPPAIQPSLTFVTPTVVDDEVEIVEVTVPTQENLTTTTTGITSIEGNGQPEGIGNTESSDMPGSGAIITEQPVKPAQLFEVDQKPEFPGGEKEMYKYLQDSLNYPPMARESGLSGTVVVRFVVNAQGRVEQVEVVHSPSKLFNAEALRVINGMPSWTPAKLKGRAVATYFVIPLKFQLL